MADGAVDREWQAAGDPRTPPQQLADLAGRRWDLHGLIAANPQAYPELRRWIAEVNPATQQPSPGMPQPPAPTLPQQYGAPTAYGVPARRRGAGWWFAGCGCLVVVALVVVLLFIGGALLSSNGDETPGGTSSEPAPGAASGDLDEQRRLFAAEREKHAALSAQLAGNPVASLVTGRRDFQLLEKSMESSGLTADYAAQVVRDARDQVAALQKRITEAEARRANASGTVTEKLVDAAGQGFIDIRWDAASECGSGESKAEGRKTAGCVSEDPLAVHILPEGELLGEWGRRIVVLHELTHLYQRADQDAHDLTELSRAERLVEQGLFQGSSEKMADCYALTYLDEWTLSNDAGSVGYGYVCNASERQAIRDWAAEIHAPMPD